MAKSISVYDIIDFTLIIVLVGFQGLTLEVQLSRKIDSRKGDFMTPVKLRYGTCTVRYRTGTVPYGTVPYRKYIDPYRTVLLRLGNGKINVSY
jgi:hypothetical protein